MHFKSARNFLQHVTANINGRCHEFKPEVLISIYNIMEKILKSNGVDYYDFIYGFNMLACNTV